MGSGLLSYRVLQFEREADGSFRRPQAYPRSAMSVITTHDLPTFVGWWRGLDTDLRQTLAIYDHGRAERERAERVVERRRLTEALCGGGARPVARAARGAALRAGAALSRAHALRARRRAVSRTCSAS